VGRSRKRPFPVVFTKKNILGGNGRTNRCHRKIAILQFCVFGIVVAVVVVVLKKLFYKKYF
jgi:hypothetical protein